SASADADAPGIDRETVRITRDVGEILGVDEREYDLASEDVVTLPTANAEPLVERDAAERIE
ncbi:DNA replication complex subunit Gins51, partial [Halorubrum halodurans]